ncbi:MAG: LysM peptidoglycan-binding domain-containing protein [Butyrivibrio sp.]|nr:LysM peptidoglycan-binding domain-containing protein [Butyrivibrio sp.]
MSEAMKIAASLYNDPRYFSKSEIRIRNNKIRRSKIVRRQYAFLLLTVSVLLFVIFFNMATLVSDAQSDTYTPEYKYYKSVSVYVGDSLWNIAKDSYSEDHYKNIESYINEICKINNLADSSDIKAGESLIIPYYSTEFR